MLQTRARLFMVLGLFLDLGLVACSDIEPTAPGRKVPASIQRSTSLQAQTNTLIDPGFELGDPSWQQITHAGRLRAQDQVRSGVYSVKLTVSKSYVRDVFQTISVTAGQSYHAETWAKTNGVNGNGASLRLVWLNGTGAVISTSVVGTAAPTQTWTRESATVIAPTGAVSVRYQLIVDKDPDNAGNAWFDDNVFGESSGTSDLEPPTVAVTSPTDGAQVQGLVVIAADASDNSGVAGVQFFVNGAPIGAEDTTTPFSASWDASTLPAGVYQLSAVARDIAGNMRTSSAISVTVLSAGGSDNVRPTVSITAPLGGTTISGGAVSVTANASDNVGVAGVLFRIDGQPAAPEDVSAPYGVTLNTTAWSNGAHVLTALARDHAGNTQASASVSVTIHNSEVVDVTYCSPGGVDQKMDVYYPPVGTPTPLPALMFIHGGGWINGDKTSDVGMFDFPRFTKRGYLVISINYRIGHNIFPAYVEDAKCAIRHLRANAAFYRIDPQRIGVWGHSAGGHIAALTATTSPGVFEGTGGYAGFSSRVQAVATYEAPFDLTGGALDFEYTVIGDIDRVFGSMKVLASPINYVTSDDPPFMVVHGTLDQSIYMPQAQKMVDALRAAGVPTNFLVVINGGHYLTAPAKYHTTASPTRAGISKLVGDFFDSILK